MRDNDRAENGLQRANNPASRRNLLLRLPARAKGNGSLQKRCKRVLRQFGKASTSDLIKWGYARRLLDDDRRRQAYRVAIKRALESIGAVRICRAKTIGRPWIWRLPDRA